MLSKIRHRIITAIGNLKFNWDRLRHATKLPSLNASDRAIVHACLENGGCATSLDALGFASTPAMLQAAEKQLAAMQAVRDRRSDIQTLGTATNPAYPQIFTVTDLPEFAAWGQEPRLLAMVENYLGVPSKFQGVHLRRDFANETFVTTEHWHKDMEDRRMLKVFVYLSDVAEVNGPFEYVPKNQVTRAIEHQITNRIAHRIVNKPGDLGITDDALAEIVPRSKWKRFTGPAGMVLLADPTAVFHHGSPRQQERVSLFFVYTTQNPLRPGDCEQYSDRTFARPDQQLQPI